MDAEYNYKFLEDFDYFLLPCNLEMILQKNLHKYKVRQIRIKKLFLQLSKLSAKMNLERSSLCCRLTACLLIFEGLSKKTLNKKYKREQQEILFFSQKKFF